jgi:hypothetical protein
LAIPLAITMTSGTTVGQCSMALQVKSMVSGGSRSKRRRGKDAQVLSGATETGLNLVDDEKDAVVVTDLAETFEVALGGRNVTSLTENRLDDESGGVARGGLLLEEELETVEGLLDEVVVGGGVGKTELVPVRVRGGEDAGL